MADPSAEEFASWLRPRDALSRLGIAEGVALKEIATRISDGRIRIAVQTPIKTGGEQGGAPHPSLIDLAYLQYPWETEWGEFSSSGQISFVRTPTALGGYASQKIVGGAGPPSQVEIRTYCGVRLDPAAMVSQFDLDLLPATAAGQQEAPLPARKGGRPAGKHGEPIARITIRMAAKSDKELKNYTAEALSVELIEEYRKLGLEPPEASNARKDAAGSICHFRMIDRQNSILSAGGARPQRR